MSKSIINYKPEIDSLRAVAVSLVILFHYELFNVKGGFIGVDVFFVISGYLITNLIIKDVDENKFSLLKFYLRRIRRIIPALYSTILAVVVLGYFILSPEHFDRISKSGVSAAAAYSNFFFWSEAGYFDHHKYFKPLLHTWSLSVELQFYIFWPIIIFIIYNYFKKITLPFVIIIFFISLFLSTVYSDRTSGYFYFTFFRLFEFAIGSIVFLIQDKIKIKSNDLFFFIGVSIILISSFIFSEKSTFPGSNALIPCIGTFLVLISAGNLKLFKKLFINKISIFTGKISYSLYLVHWPLIVLYKYIKLEPLDDFEKILLIFITIIISFFSYKFIELPFRKRTTSKFIVSEKKMVLTFSLSLTFIFLISNYLVSNTIFSKLSPIKQQSLKLLEKEKKFLQNFENEANERISSNNYFKNKNKTIKVLVWGDSHAGDLYNSLKITKEFSNLDLEYLSYDYFYCFKDKVFTDAIVSFIKNNLKLSTQNCKNKIQKHPIGYEILSKSDLIIITNRWVDDINFNEIRSFIRKHTSSKVILVGRKPRFFHIPTLHVKSNKDLNHLAFLNRNKEISKINDLIKNKSMKNDFIFYDIENLVCSKQSCKVFDKNNILISDEDHWSYRGYIFYGKMLFDNNFLEIISKNNS